MKLFASAGAVISLVFVAVGLFWLYTPGMFSTGQILCILGLLCGLSLSFGLYAFQLRDRIEALEKRLRELP